jgi:peptide/nickel transport system permease protein
VLGAAIVLLLIGSALLAPVLATHDPLEMNPRNRLLPPSLTHLFGTDDLGRDVFSRILYGGRVSLQVGLMVIGIGVVAGGLIGLVSGFYGRWLDLVLERFIDIMLAIPGLLLALSIAGSLGPGLGNVMIATGVSTIPVYARLVRGSVLSEKENDYVLASRAVGVKTYRILFYHLVPNIMSSIVVLSTLQIGGAILVAAALSFLGLGAQPPTPEWGAMISGGRNYIREAWWLTTFPGIIIMLTVLGFNLLGDGLLETLDPRHL